MTRTAKCCCGDCRITLEGEPTLNAICNCDDCKRRTGSAFGWNAYFNDSQVIARTGNWSQYSPKVDPEQKREFCTSCGSSLIWTSPFMPNQIGVAGGALIDPPLEQPLHSARDEARCIWLARPEGTEPWP